MAPATTPVMRPRGPAWWKRALGIFSGALALQVLACAQGAGGGSPARPSVLIFVADDLGYADIGVHGCQDIPTPSIDALAREGVRCTSGYVTAPRCAPSRCALLTGRYQQRYGCELDAERGLPPEETTLAQRLGPAGYATGLVGKWHLGRAPEDHPNLRGFDEFFGFLGGLNPYLPRGTDEFVPKILRNGEPAQVTGYLTDAFGREAALFLERHAKEPFFLLVSFSAPHGPLEAQQERLARFAEITDPTRQKYAAVVSAMDDAIGAVLAKLRALELDQKTLVFFLNDNGGPLTKRMWNGSSNAPLRGQKGGLLEGGIRVAFLARWPGVLPAGRVYDPPVSALDIVPTVLAQAGVAPEKPGELDGVNILPHLAGLVPDPPHGALFWRFNLSAGPELHKWAIRQGDWKLVHSPERDPTSGEPRGVDFTGLYDVAHDPAEATDLRAARPEMARQLEARWQEWNASLPSIRPGPVPTPTADDEPEDG